MEKRSTITARILRFPIILLLIYLSVPLLLTVFQFPMDFRSSTTLFPFLFGLVIGAAIFSMLCKFSPVYIFGHEFTHWLTAKIFRRRTGRFRIGLASGSVEIERPNLWISLSPYFIPLYTLIWSGIYLLIRQFNPLPAGHYEFAAIGGIGLTYAYHLVMTAFAFHRDQQDLRAYGTIFSLSLILFINLLLIFAALLAVTGEWAGGSRLLWHQLQRHTQFFLELLALNAS